MQSNQHTGLLDPMKLNEVPFLASPVVGDHHRQQERERRNPAEPPGVLRCGTFSRYSFNTCKVFTMFQALLQVLCPRVAYFISMATL